MCSIWFSLCLKIKAGALEIFSWTCRFTKLFSFCAFSRWFSFFRLISLGLRGLHSFPLPLCLRPRWSWSFAQSGRKFCSRRETDDNRRHQPANEKIYLSKCQDIFVQMSKYMFPLCKMHLYKWQDVFVQIANLWERRTIWSYHCCQMIRRRGGWEGDKILALARRRAPRISTWDFEFNDNI